MNIKALLRLLRKCQPDTFEIPPRYHAESPPLGWQSNAAKVLEYAHTSNIESIVDPEGSGHMVIGDNRPAEVWRTICRRG
jgi:hypothetical protein